MAGMGTAGMVLCAARFVDPLTDSAPLSWQHAAVCVNNSSSACRGVRRRQQQCLPWCATTRAAVHAVVCVTKSTAAGRKGTKGSAGSDCHRADRLTAMAA